jgi:hypothetical protein
MEDEAVHGLGITKAHLDLGGVYVDVHRRRVEFEKQHEGGMAFQVQDVAIRFAHGVDEQPVAHEAAVDVEILGIARALGVGGTRRHAPQTQAAGALVEPDRRSGEFFAQYVGDARFGPFRAGRQTPRRARVVLQVEADGGARQGNAAQCLLAMRILGRFAFQELAPCGGIEVEIARFHTGSLRVCGGRGGRNDAALPFHAPRLGVIGTPAHQREARDGGKACQRFAAKTQARHAFEFFQRGDLAGGVAHERKAELLARDAGAVVGHAQKLHAALG